MSEPKYYPQVSVIMPIRNEESFIQKSLSAVLSQDYPPEKMQIIVADGMSTDNTRQIISNLSSKFPFHSVLLVDNRDFIVPTGLNAAIRQAKGNFILRVDGHTIIAPDYVKQCVDLIQQRRVENVGGKMNAVGSNLFGKVVAVATSTPFGVGGSRFHYSNEEEWVDTVYMGAWPRRVFEKIGLFDEELVRDQDDEFNYRLRKAGGKILLSPQIKSKYIVRSTPLALWCQYFQYGLWKVRVLQKHPHQMSLRQFIPPTFVFALLISLSVIIIDTLGLWLFGLVTGAYLSVNLAASFWAALKHGRQYLPILPLAFSILHISYGLGFLVGLLKFADRWGDKVGKVPSWEDVKKRTAFGN